MVFVIIIIIIIVLLFICIGCFFAVDECAGGLYDTPSFSSCTLAQLMVTTGNDDHAHGRVEAAAAHSS